jgi:spore germination protein GerM
VAPANTPKPTVVVQPTAIPQPTAAPKPTAVPQPTAAPPAEVRNEFVWLYFGDTTGTLYVPVQRRVAVENRQSARAALLALIDGPHTDLKALVSRDTRLLGVRIEDGTAYANFDRDPSGDNERGYDAIVLTLTHFQTIERVQIQINGRNLAGARARPVVNPVNPLGLPVDARQTEFLPLYFLSNDGYHHIRIIRMVPKTRQTAEGTMRALLEGPGAYGYALQRTIPDGTDLRGISIDNGIVNVDLTEPFANASDRATVVRTVTESLTTLPGVRGVRFFIEGSTAGDWWGAEYGQIFERGLINGE